jgi:hypothetical protein
MYSFTNNEADKIAKSAFNLMRYAHDGFKTNFKLIKTYSKHYVDVMEIACMIENNQPNENIAAKLYKLPYEASDRIPSSVFVKYKLDN